MVQVNTFRRQLPHTLALNVQRLALTASVEPLRATATASLANEQTGEISRASCGAQPTLVGRGKKGNLRLMDDNRSVYNGFGMLFGSDIDHFNSARPELTVVSIEAAHAQRMQPIRSSHLAAITLKYPGGCAGHAQCGVVRPSKGFSPTFVPLMEREPTSTCRIICTLLRQLGREGRNRSALVLPPMLRVKGIVISTLFGFVPIMFLFITALII